MERLLLNAELMSFVLPGNARPLRFSGEVKAISPDAKGDGALALGRPRIRKTLPSPAPLDSFSDATTSRQPAPKGRRLSTPPPGYLNPRPNAESSPFYDNGLRRRGATLEPRNGEMYRPVHRERMASIDDEQPTMSMERHELDVLPGGRARTRRISSPPMAAVPHFRPATSAAPMPAFVGVAGTRSSVVSRTTGAPLAIWLVAGALAAIVSFHVTTEIAKPSLTSSPSAAAQHP